MHWFNAESLNSSIATPRQREHTTLGLGTGWRRIPDIPLKPTALANARAQWRVSPSRADAIATLLMLQAAVRRASLASGTAEAHRRRCAEGDASAGHVAEHREDGGSASAGPSPEAPRSMPALAPTTVMVHNLPSACTPEQLLDLWPSDSGYNFLYAPTGSGGKRLAGFAYVNLASPAEAAVFSSRWHCAHLPGWSGGRPLRVAWAHIQGLEANLQELEAKGQKLRRKSLLVVRGVRVTRS